jgi:putative ABC transport system permease protein
MERNMTVLDLRLAWRGLRRAPGLAAAIIVALATGIGGSTLVFSVIDTLLLQPLPFSEPNRLVTIDPPVSNWEIFEQLKKSSVFEAIGGYTERAASLTAGDDTERALVARMTETCMATLGVRPVSGRAFVAGEFQPGKGQVALLSDGFWRRHYGGTQDAVGRTLVVDDRPYTVVGVLPQTFRTLGELEAGGEASFDRRVAIVVPFAGGPMFWRDPSSSDQASRGLTIIGRLRPGIPVERARTEVSTVIERAPRPAGVARLNHALVPVATLLVRDLPAQMTLLSLAVGMLLLVACANVANLLLERGEARRREIAIRASVGASAGALIQTALVEVVSLSVAGGALGMLLAWGGIRVIQAAAGGMLTRLDELALNVRLLGFATVVSIAAALVAGLFPAVRLARTDAARWLQARACGPRVGGRLFLSSRLVVAEVALSVVLVMVGSLLVRDFVGVASVKTGFEPTGVLSADISLSRSRYGGDRALVFLDSVLQRAATLPDVEGAALANPLPGSYTAGFVRAEVEGRTPGFVLFRIVSPNYFSVLSIPVVAGRAFSERDSAAAPGVVMVNDVFARQYWGGTAIALGKRVAVGAKAADSGPVSRTPAEFRLDGYVVVGVTGSLREHGSQAAEQPEVYWTVRQSEAPTRSNPITQMYLLLKARHGNATALTAPLRDLMRTLDPHQPLYNVQTLAHVMSAKLGRQRLLVTMMAVFAGLTLVLALVGVHGVMAYAVALRRHELAVRLALGSTPREVLGLVLRWSLTVVARGVALGAPTALAWTWFSSAQIFAVTGTDPLTCMSAVLFVAVAGMAASLIPAWRATRVDPSVALRDE